MRDAHDLRLPSPPRIAMLKRKPNLAIVVPGRLTLTFRIALVALTIPTVAIAQQAPKPAAPPTQQTQAQPQQPQPAQQTAPPQQAAPPQQTSSPPQFQQNPAWANLPKMQLERQFAGPLQDTIVQRWRDPVDGSVCYIFLPISAPVTPPNAAGFQQYGANNIGSISCMPGRAGAPAAAAPAPVRPPSSPATGTNR